jgi:hypothetical protein
MVGWILFIFGIQQFIHPRSMPVQHEYSSSKNKDLSEGPQNREWQFSQKWLEQF